jgi:hypothetical protein
MRKIHHPKSHPSPMKWKQKDQQKAQKTQEGVDRVQAGTKAAPLRNHHPPPKNKELDAICTLDVSEPSSEEEWPTTDGKKVPDELSKSPKPTTESIEPGEARGSVPETEVVPLLSLATFFLFFR